MLNNVGCDVHRRQPVLQPAGPQQDRRDIQRQLREGIIGRDADASRVCSRLTLHLPVGRHATPTTIHPRPHLGDSNASK